ncbi:hypothetical protein EMCRGX_G016731 [Ephydatia muelleri]
MMNHFGWKRIAVLTQNEDIFTLAELNVRKVLGKANYTVQSRVFETNSDLVTSIDDLFFHEDDYRIFFLNCYSGPASGKIVCMAAKMKYTYPRYAWVLNSWYTSKWWTAAEDTDTVSCTDDEFEAFLEKVLIVHSLPAAADYTGPTGLGAAITSQRYLSEYENRCTQEIYYATEDGGRAYDTTWILALALNSTMAMVTNGNINGTDGMPDPVEYSENQLSGVTGHIQFDINGTRMLDTVLLKHAVHDGLVVRLSSTNLNNAITVGAALMYASIYTNLVPTDVVSIVKSMCAMVLLYRNDDLNSTTQAPSSSGHDMVSPTLTSHTQESQVTSLQDTIQKMRAVISSQETEDQDTERSMHIGH